MKTAQLDVSAKFVSRVVELSQGLPHYTHLLSQHGGVSAVQSDRAQVTVTDLNYAIDAALRNVSQTVRDRYRFIDPLLPPYIVMKGTHYGGARWGSSPAIEGALRLHGPPYAQVKPSEVLAPVEAILAARDERPPPVGPGSL